jgi:hypothetical protein
MLVQVVAAVGACRDDSPLEVYWRSVLPNTTIPNSIHNLIDPGTSHVFFFLFKKILE